MKNGIQPNILVIMTDEHAPQASEVYGAHWIKTPAMKELSQKGVTFTQAYCDSPLCVPSRMAFMTGRKVHRIGVWDNGAPLSSGIPTIAHYLDHFGYDTALSGKMHFKGPDQRHGFRHRLVDDCCSPTIGAPDSDGSGVLLNDAIRRLMYVGPDDAAVANWYDDKVEEAAIEYLRAQHSDQKPFALFASFNAPHFPLTPRKKFWDYYEGVVPDPEKTPANASPPHVVEERLRVYFGLDKVTPDMTKKARTAYFALVSQTDERIGRLLSVLDDVELGRPTVVIYTADHGEMMGEHGMWWKCNFYEQSVRVPLIVSCPTLFSPRVERFPATLVDVARTLIELAHPADDLLVLKDGVLDGLDLTPLLMGKPGNPDRIVTSEYHAHGTGASMKMIRQGRFKLNVVLGETPQLFDLEDDPHEWVDRSADPSMTSLVRELTSLALIDWPRDIQEQIQMSRKDRHMVSHMEQTLKDQLYLKRWIPIGSE